MNDARYTNRLAKRAIKLNHNDLVRVKGWDNYSDITVGTITGCAIEDRRSIAEAYERAVKNGHRIEPFTIQSAAVICADYPGKAEKHAREQAARAAAPAVDNGDLVEIEGQFYTVRLTRPNNCDPIHFIKVEIGYDREFSLVG